MRGLNANSGGIGIGGPRSKQAMMMRVDKLSEDSALLALSRGRPLGPGLPLSTAEQARQLTTSMMVVRVGL